LLQEKNITFQYREYKKTPLSNTEWKEVLQKLSLPANTLLRKRDKMYKELGLNGTESDEKLLPYFAEYPSLVQRPIYIVGKNAVIGRPIEQILKLIN
jgi:arsenate reductase (glutaredoxin)